MPPDTATHIKPITDQTLWENFISTQPQANFLSSWYWGEFNHSLSKKIFRLGIYKNSLIGVCQIVKETAKRGNYLTIAGNPIMPWSAPIFNVLLTYLTQLAKTENCLFVRIRPQLLDSLSNRQLFTSSGLTLSPMHLTADLTLQLDLTPPLDAILAQMRKNTRYSIRQAAKHHLAVTQSTDPADIKTFYQHQLELAEKHHFVPFSYDFLHRQFTVFSQANLATLFHCFHGTKLLASAFVIFYNGEAVYHYGISTPENSKLPGSYAVLWEAIQTAKARDCHRFNFWGVAPQNQPDHRFSSISLFKRGFGGSEVAYLPAHDLPTSRLYSLTKIFETLRAKRRHL